MKKLILLPFLFLLMVGQCQEPDLHGYTQNYVDSLIVIIDYQDSIINSELIRPDTFDLSFDYNGIIVNAKRNDDDIWLSIIEGEKRSHLWSIGGNIEVRFAVDSIQGQTWLPEHRIIQY